MCPIWISTALSTFAGDSVVVPFEALPTGHLVVQATVDGHGPYRFVVDTGANAFVIDPQVAADLGFDLDKAAHKKVHAADGAAVEIPVIVLRNVALADYVVPKALTVATAVDPLLGQSGVVGILGRDLFADRRLEVDFPDHEIRVLDSSRTEGALRLVRLRGGLTGVELEDGLTVVIDLGADISILNAAGARLLGAQSATPIPGVATGLGGPIETSEWVELPPLDLGDPTPGGHVPVVELDLFSTLHLDGPTLLLGVDQMQGRILTIDYGAKSMSLHVPEHR